MAEMEKTKHGKVHRPLQLLFLLLLSIRYIVDTLPATGTIDEIDFALLNTVSECKVNRNHRTFLFVQSLWVV